MTMDGVEAIRAGDEAAFSHAVGRHQRELQVHCYRMLGSFEEARDLTQEAFLRAWTGRATFRGDAPLRAWLYRIATNACLDFLAKHPRRPMEIAPDQHGPAVRVPWLQPYPDDIAPEPEPDAATVAKETVELAFLAALQHLTPKERAVLILRDVLGWSAREVSEALGAGVGAVTSRLQRARITMRVHLPERRADWSATTAGQQSEREVLRRFMAALERADDDAIAALLHEDVLVAHQGRAGGNLSVDPVWYSGRATVVDGWAPILHGPHAQELRMVLTSANNAPAYAVYARDPGSDKPFEPFAFSVLRVENGLVVELTTFGVEMVAAFGLPGTVAA
ncbi:RNA polymerase subunit sigma-70 [Pseudonocardia sp. TRM90224]|uniref:RNA polymerase subunit sigma-70 n=1 Tax=Pseudonocardia sp. TRM90224 TaxID=2812678 RepID=UPI001E513C1C|nr:RNA polymerase subunit sigma-70 [Pseudonocardia sp. TRM90224]